MPQTQPLSLVISSISGRSAVSARIALGAAMIAVAVGAIDLANSRAADGADGIGMARASNGIGCGGFRPSFMAEAALEAGTRRHSPVSLDRKVAGPIPVWKTIALGTYASRDALRDALNGGCRVGDLASEILARPTFAVSKTPGRIALVVLSAADLGFDGADGVPRAVIFKRAKQLGLQLCPAETAPQLRLQYRDQPVGEFLHVAMNPVTTRRYDAAAFVVGNGGAGLLLIGSDARPERVMPPTTRFVFARSS